MGRKKKRKMRHNRHSQAKPKSAVSLKRLPFNGDHGPIAEAATANTVLVPIAGDPNRHAYRYRVNSVDLLEGRLTMRQMQAARAIQIAYSKNQQLSSGSPLKERVQSSLKPDAIIASQIKAQSRLERCMAAVRPSERALVEGVCWHDKRLGVLARDGYPRTLARFRMALDRVADHLGY